MRGGFRMFAVASEVATLTFLRSVGLPTPRVYGYSPTPDSAAGTEYIFMQCVQGTNLGDIFYDLEERDIISILPQVTELESKMISMAFPAGGSLYFAEDLVNVAESASGPTRPGIALKDKCFCVGPETSLPLWFGRRSVVSLIDWQHTAILPLSLHAGIPQRLQNYDDPGWQSMTPPLLLEKLDDLNETQQRREIELYRCRLVHYHYVKNTYKYNIIHYATMTDPMGVLRSRLFYHASNPWEDETLALKVALIQATENWETLTGGGAPCPTVFDAEDVRETMKLDEVLREADATLEACQNIIGHGPEGWVSTQHYEEAMARGKQMKAATSAEEQAEIVGHWPWDDMNEDDYM
ncbi:hypothetical protein EDD18DRAFT_1410353 [Armillaria luteobubalina]|uniref:Aminoglycoside phosphotransferase domain-containing protein n=1 Tax=Armillaria luteobubalina TaxID=153913 RepID=A0AA39PXQ2_9AGAR|nr:hypothetical protein EDD18DRAFT_1410353 [Armillaria luteobubalina]